MQKFLGKEPLESLRSRWENNMKIGVMEICYEDRKRIPVAHLFQTCGCRGAEKVGLQNFKNKKRVTL